MIGVLLHRLKLTTLCINIFHKNFYPHIFFISKSPEKIDEKI